MTLYATRGSSRYHSDPRCTGLNAHATWNDDYAGMRVPVVTRAQAVRRGLLPCRACQPPPLLAVVPDTPPW